MSLAAPAQVANRSPIGIITGSGPDAGIDLWQKVLNHNKHRLGNAFRGDLDAPHVEIISVPGLGLSMELEAHEETVWRFLEKAVRALDGRVRAFAIACNTLNYFQDRIAAMEIEAEHLSFSDAVMSFLVNARIPEAALLGARPVMELGAWSPYSRLLGQLALETPEDHDVLHQLIYDVKALGPDGAGLRERLAEIVRRLTAETVLLSCTELPLIATEVDGHRLVDVTELVAAQLVERSFRPWGRE